MEIQTIHSAVAGIRRINEFLSMEELPEQKVVSKEEGKGKEEGAFVEFRNVTFGYDERKILKQLSFQVKTGRTGDAHGTYRSRKKYDFETPAWTL